MANEAFTHLLKYDSKGMMSSIKREYARVQSAQTWGQKLLLRDGREGDILEVWNDSPIWDEPVLACRYVLRGGRARFDLKGNGTPYSRQVYLEWYR